MTELIFTWGLPGSGKSTWAKLMQKEGYYWLSSDKIRKAVHMSNQDLFNSMNQTAIRLLKEGKNVVYDATNLGRRHRMNSLSRIKAKCPSAFCRIELFIVPFNVQEERNHNRDLDEVVPEEVIDKFKRSMQLPQYFEGWDSIHINEGSIGEWFNYEKCIDFNQRNPYHDLTLSQHMNKTYSLAKERGYGAIVKAAAIFHDIGKVLTQTIDENGVAHYYGHENVGAYLFLLCYLFFNGSECDYDKCADIIFLINYHMRPYHWTEKSFERDTKLFGRCRMTLLKQLHYCDEDAH